MSDQSKMRRSGGPKSALGKAKSSLNSLKHGIASSLATSVNEQSLIDSYAKELEDFYDPQSPLEKLQIQRIAICRAKLAKLYEVESARLEIRSNKLEHSTESIFKELQYVEGVVKGMVHEMALYGQLILPLRLTSAVLEKIAQEVHALEVKSEIKDPWRLLPSLSHFLDGIISFNTNEPLVSRLDLVSSYISKVLSQGDLYHEHLKLMLGSNDNFSLEEEDVVEEEDELDILIKQSQEKYRQKQRGHQKLSVAPAVVTEEKLQNPTSVDILERCKVFVDLYRYNQEAKRAFEQFLQTKSLMLKSVTLPSNESDLLMRYQTTLERRLSSAIGELLALQRQRSTK
jgi:hypothetical protein